MKAVLRETVRGLVRGISPGQRRLFSSQICERLQVEPVWHSARTVLLFAPLPDEPEVTPLLDEALLHGKSVRLPRWEQSLGHYVACEIKCRSDLVAGRYGVLEPRPVCSVQPLNQLDFILVPGVAFDFAGRRLGRGKGFYDRLLAEVRGHKCGVCYDLQVVPEVPEESHDIRLSSILTPTRWRLCQGAV